MRLGVLAHSDSSNIEVTADGESVDLLFGGGVDRGVCIGLNHSEALKLRILLDSVLTPATMPTATEGGGLTGGGL